MLEALHNAGNELKRADHLIFVSLKYTRTVDVIKNIIKRLLNAYNYMFDTLLNKGVEEEILSSVPTLPRLKIDFLKQLYPDDFNMGQFIDFYKLLRKIDRARFSRIKEFRRHVAMIALIDDEKIEISIDIIHDYFTRTKEFLELVTKMVREEA